jgi:hypothetical protein
MAKNNKVVFKSYGPLQAMLLPPSLEELIPLAHPVRMVNEVYRYKKTALKICF